MPINCLIKCLINFWAFERFVFQNKLMVYGQRSMVNGLWSTVYGQRSMVYGLSSLPLLVPLTLWLLVPLTFWLFVFLTLCPFDSLTLWLFDSSSLSLLVEKFRQKNQQFWAIFQRFDINIFNLREHFSPPNFAYSARNFSLPSPNLN